MNVRVIHGDAFEVLRTLPDASVHCCVTSPPYWGLRDYGVAGQIGLEATPIEYVQQLVAVFREVRRVLRDDGTLWLNLGDSYSAGNGTKTNGPQTNITSVDGVPVRMARGATPSDDRATLTRTFAGMPKPKDLIGIPWRVAFALQDDGWWLRSDIIWSKPNPMPESVMDRPTSSHEHVFLLTKSSRYFFDAEAVKETGVIPAGTLGAKGSEERFATKGVNSRPPEYKEYTGTRNIRNVWTISTQPYADAHFATMPSALAERCIKAGTSERGCCAKCASPVVRTVEKERTRDGVPLVGSFNNGDGYRIGASGVGHWRDKTTTSTTGWAPSCQCNAETMRCTVLDPFGGAGTTALVADRLQRNAILIELNEEYVAMARRRISEEAPLLATVA